MPRDLFQQPSLARSFGIPSAGGASLTIRKSRHRADPPVPPWCKLTPAILRQGRGSVQYEHCIDHYAIEELEVTDLRDSSQKKSGKGMDRCMAVS